MTDEEKKVLKVITHTEMMAESSLENIKAMLIQLSIEVEKVLTLLRKHRQS